MSSIHTIFQTLQQQKLSSSEIVNEELSKIIALILWDYIGNWYSTFSNDRELYSEVGQALALLIQEIERRLNRVDLVALLTNDLPKILMTHIKDYRTCCSKAGTAYAGSQSFEELFYGLQPHVALKNSESEALYLRRVSQVLVNTLLSESEMQSESIRLLVRELLSNSVLFLIVDNLSDPAYINELILQGLDPDVLEMINGEFSPKSGESDMSDYSDVSLLTDTEYEIQPTNLNGSAGDVYRSTDYSLSNIQPLNTPVKKQKSFLKAKKRRDSAFAQGLNKITFGGLDKLNNGMERLKVLVNPNEKGIEKRRKQSKSFDGKKDKKSLKNFKPTSVPDFDYDGGSDQLLSELEEEAIQEKALGSDEQFNSLKGRHGVAKELIQEDSSSENVTVPPGEGVPEPEPVGKQPKVRFAQESSNSSSDNPEFMQPITKSQQFLKKATELFNIVWQLRYETRHGPKRLGNIDTTIYDRFRLEENFVLLFEELFEMYSDRTWTYIQLHFFVRPVVTRTLGHVINRCSRLIRAVLKVVHTACCDVSVAFYCECFREAFWPNGYPCPKPPIRSDAEKDILFKSALGTLTSIASGIYH